jgi:hypothetical protein
LIMVCSSSIDREFRRLLVLFKALISLLNRNFLEDEGFGKKPSVLGDPKPPPAY